MVTAAASTKRYTIDDLAQFPDDGKLRELVDGQIVEWDVTTVRHGFFLIEIAGMLRAFVREHRLGIVVGADPMVQILGSRHDARGPDIAFFARGRVPDDVDLATTTTTPDFVIEILSPSHRASLVQAKVRDWLRAGVRLLWYVDPEAGVTTVYGDGHIAYVDADEPLEGGDVVPGFSLRLREVFDELTSMQTTDG